MTITKKEISASEFKKYFLNLVDEVKNKNSEFIITKRKVPFAQIIPLQKNDSEHKTYFGCLKSNIKINDNIVDVSFENDWEMNL